MKIDTAYNALALTMAELSTLARQPGMGENALSLVPKVEAENKPVILADFARLDKDRRDAYARAIVMLAAPSQVARLHYSIADELVTRMYLAWRPDEKTSVAVLALSGGNLEISLQPIGRVETTLSQALGLNASLSSANLRQAFSATAAIVLIAIMDYFRYARYRALLVHQECPVSFTRQDIVERLQDASAEDFRWPLLLLDKVFPVPIATRFQVQDVTAALEELCARNLLVKNEASQADLTLYSLTPGTDIMRDSLVHDVSRAALSTSSVGADGYIGHEAMLIERGTNHLWLFGIGGVEGLVASIDAAQFSEILQKALAPSDRMPPTVNTSPRPSRVTQTSQAAAGGVSTCPRCGTQNAAGGKFCMKCGGALASAAKFCPKCGDPVKAGEKFCDKCGTKLA